MAEPGEDWHWDKQFTLEPLKPLFCDENLKLFDAFLLGLHSSFADQSCCGGYAAAECSLPRLCGYISNSLPLCICLLRCPCSAAFPSAGSLLFPRPRCFPFLCSCLLNIFFYPTVLLTIDLLSSFPTLFLYYPHPLSAHSQIVSLSSVFFPLQFSLNTNRSGYPVGGAGLICRGFIGQMSMDPL